MSFFRKTRGESWYYFKDSGGGVKWLHDWAGLGVLTFSEVPGAFAPKELRAAGLQEGEGQ